MFFKSGKFIVLYLGAIVGANLIIAWIGPSAAFAVAAGLIGLDLSSRDKLHDLWGGNGLWWKMLLLIGCGSLLSWIINRDAGDVALASLAAFAGAGLVDALVYHLLRDRALLLRVNGSNVLSALVDSLIFPALAFGWPPAAVIVLGQFAAKVAGGFLWSLILNMQKKSGTANKPRLNKGDCRGVINQFSPSEYRRLCIDGDWSVFDDDLPPDGVPCGHPGCLNHLTHPCEGCGRIAGQRRHQSSSNGERYG